MKTIVAAVYPSQDKDDIEMGGGIKRPNTNDWWTLRAGLYPEDDDGREKLKSAILNDFIAWTVFVALLMTVDFAALFIMPSSVQPNHEVLTVVYVGCFALGAVCSVSAAFAGIQAYNFYNGLPIKMLEKAIRSAEFIANPAQYATVAAIATFAGTVIGIYLVFGTTSLIVASIIFGWGIVEYLRILSKIGLALNTIPEVKIIVLK